MEQNYIGISEDRLHHILGVARKAYKIAKDMGHDEDFCRRCFMLGWIHDVGYEFAENQSEHPDISAKMLLLINEDTIASDLKKPFYKAIKEHGKYPSGITEEHSEMTEEYRILNMADMQVDNQGNKVSVSQRLDDIKNRYGEHSNQYLTACDICYLIGLTAVNFAANIT